MQLANGLGIAEHFGVSKQAVRMWEVRNPDYPEPLDLPHVVGIPLWDLADVEAWRERHSQK